MIKTPSSSTTNSFDDTMMNSYTPHHTTHYPTPPPAAPDSVMQHILEGTRKQIEFYFSMYNLQRDQYLMHLLACEPAVGAVAAALIAQFPKVNEWHCFYMASFGGNMHPVDLVIQAMRDSRVVHVTDDGFLVPDSWPTMEAMRQRQYASPVPTSVSSQSSHLSSSSPRQAQQGSFYPPPQMSSRPHVERPMPNYPSWRETGAAPFYPSETYDMPPLMGHHVGMPQGTVAWEQQQQQYHQQQQQQSLPGQSYEGQPQLHEGDEQEQEYYYYPQPNEFYSHDSIYPEVPSQNGLPFGGGGGDGGGAPAAGATQEEKPPATVVTTPRRPKYNKPHAPGSPAGKSDTSSSHSSKKSYEHKKLRKQKEQWSRKNHKKYFYRRPQDKQEDKHEDEQQQQRQTETPVSRKTNSPVLKEADFPPLDTAAVAQNPKKGHGWHGKKKKNKKNKNKTNGKMEKAAEAPEKAEA